MQLWPITVAIAFRWWPCRRNIGPAVGTSDCTAAAAVCCMGPAWGARWPAAECSTAAPAAQRNYGFLFRYFPRKHRTLSAVTRALPSPRMMTAQRRGGGG